MMFGDKAFTVTSSVAGGEVVIDVPSGTSRNTSMALAGSLKVTDGMLAQMKLFAGLTKLVAEKVPGVAFLVNQSQASADFTIENGVFKSDNVRIEGGFISVMLILLIVKPKLSLKRPVAVAIAAIVIGFAVLRNLPFAPFTYLAPIPLP